MFRNSLNIVEACEVKNHGKIVFLLCVILLPNLFRSIYKNNHNKYKYEIQIFGEKLKINYFCFKKKLNVAKMFLCTHKKWNQSTLLNTRIWKNTCCILHVNCFRLLFNILKKFYTIRLLHQSLMLVKCWCGWFTLKVDRFYSRVYGISSFVTVSNFVQ